MSRSLISLALISLLLTSFTSAQTTDMSDMTATTMSDMSDMTATTMSDMTSASNSSAAATATNSSTMTTATTTTYPTSLLTTYAVDIHYISGDTNDQYIAYHFCSGLPSGVTQCDVYDGASNTSKLIGTEFIISNATFASLSDDEKVYWHSHAFPITSGLFVLPEVSADQELAVLQSLIDTYGKAINFGSLGGDFPAGAPEQVYGLANSNQINTTVADSFDSSLGLSTTYVERAQQRASLVAQPVIAGTGNDGNMTSYVQFVAQNFNETA